MRDPTGPNKTRFQKGLTITAAEPVGRTKTDMNMTMSIQSDAAAYPVAADGFFVSGSRTSATAYGAHGERGCEVNTLHYRLVCCMEIYTLTHLPLRCRHKNIQLFRYDTALGRSGTHLAVNGSGK